jgi:DNA-directed RNA polymerase subunit F
MFIIDFFMDFQRDSICSLSNYETYLVVKQIHETNNERESGKRGKKGQNRTLEHCNFGLNTVTYETLKYLEQTPCIEQNPDIITKFYKEVKKFDLKKTEILQILNLRPTTPVELQLIIEDSETRLTEVQSNELIDLIRTQLPPIGGLNETNVLNETMES